MVEPPKELKEFLALWQDTPSKTKSSFERLLKYLAAKNDIVLTFHSRPGVSYSLRTSLTGKRARPFFAIIDIIDDPDNRWLSVCFYEGTMTDPDEKGTLIPRGILGEDGYCFDLEVFEESYLNYIEKRIEEAFQNALALKEPA